MNIIDTPGHVDFTSYKVPRIVFVNKMDKIGADFFNCVHMIEDRTGATAIPVGIPIGAETELEGLIDLVTMEEWLWQGEDLGASWIKAPIRDDLKDQADEWRGKMIEAAVEMDDDAMMEYLETFQHCANCSVRAALS